MENYKQIAQWEETETLITIDYSEGTLNIYTNRATVMNRLQKLGYKPSKLDKINGEVFGADYKLPIEYIGKFLRTGIFKHN